MKTTQESNERGGSPAVAAKPERYAAVPEGGPSPAVLFLGGGSISFGVAVYAGIAYGAPGVVLTLAATALVLVIASFWTSIRMLIGETRLSAADAYAIGAQHTEMEQKRAVLRALKDLEFERAVGKISEEDYRHLVARFRAEAKALLQVIDEKAQAKRARAEKVVGAHLQKKGVVVEPKSEPGVSFEPLEEKQQAEREPKADDAKADEAKADDAKADEAKADEAKAGEAKADDAKADEADEVEPTDEAENQADDAKPDEADETKQTKEEAK